MKAQVIRLPTRKSYEEVSKWEHFSEERKRRRQERLARQIEACQFSALANAIQVFLELRDK